MEYSGNERQKFSKQGLFPEKNLTIFSHVLPASLFMVLIISGVNQFSLNQSAKNFIQSEGRSLSKTAARLALSEDKTDLAKWSQSILALGNNFNAAYFVLTGPSGNTLAEAKQANASIPELIIPDTPSSWYAERRVEMPSGGRKIQEFTGPVLSDNGDLESFVTIGLFEPKFSVKKQVKTLPLLFLISFLFVSTLYLVLTKTRPGFPRQILTRLQHILDGSAKEAELDAPIPGFSGPIAQQVRSLLADYWKKIQNLENENSDLQVTQKVSLYTKNRFELIFEEFPDGVMLMNDSAVVTYANSKIEIFLGKPKEQIIGHKFHDWCQDESLRDFFARFQTIQSRLRRKKEILVSPSYLPDRNLSIGAYPVETRDSKAFLGTLIICRDVTAEALAKQARGDFVAHVSHELKSPLNVLKMYSELLMGEEGNELEIRTEAVNVISDEVERLALLINNLLSISKIEMGSISLERQRVKLLELLTDAFRTVSRNAKDEELELKLELPHELSPLSLDKDLFRVAINNLLTNAIKYNRPHGSVTLTAEETESQIFIQVKDTGLGISEHDQEHILEKFYRSDSDQVREKPGHGLGLALAKNIIEVHQGKLMLESTLGVGSTFTIIFEKGTGLVQEGV